jgi:hypothetical protein
MLKSVPGIGAYARASEMTLNGIAGLASLFGYSRPSNLENINRIVPTYGSNMASATVDNSFKLAFDPKQEVTIDPRVAGAVSSDEMSISSIVQREAYIGQMTWTTSYAEDTTLGTFIVTPMQVVTGGSNLAARYWSPVAYVGNTFANWRGTLRFRFQVVSATTHKGRIRIVYNPLALFFNQANTFSTNLLETHLCDITEQKDFTIEVGWRQNRPYLDNRTSVYVESNECASYDSSDITASYRDDMDNGMLAVIVQNRLTNISNTNGNSIKINVFVSAGEDFEYVNPRGPDPRYEFFLFQPAELQDDPPTEDPDLTPQSGEVDPMADTECCQDEPVSTTLAATLGSETNHLNSVNTICFGDPVTSIRTLLKRYTLHRLFYYVNAVAEIPSWTFPDFPAYRGQDPTGLVEITGGIRYNYVRPTPMNWYARMFLGRRGGIRWKYFLQCPEGSNASLMRLATSADYSFANPSMNFAYATGESNVDLVSSLIDGGFVTPTQENPVLEAEMPYHHGLRYFFNAREINGNSYYNTRNHFLSLQVPTAGSVYWNSYVAAADDFSFTGFLCTPVTYYRPVLPTITGA